METPEVDGPSHLPPFLVGLSCWAQKETGGGLEAYLAVSRQNCRLLLISRADEQTDGQTEGDGQRDRQFITCIEVCKTRDA